jgi:hypothetical protein
VTEVTKCFPCPPDPRERIVQAIAIEQEQLARILTSLADKAEKAANWLPDTAPDEPFNVIVDKVRALECVMAQEISALAMKEHAMKGLLRQLCPGNHDELPCPCPCKLFYVCKITKRCPVSCHMDLDLECQDP